MEMDFIINDFEGPLDLLIHLIKESKMDIMNIEIESITKQYIDFIEKQERLNLEVSSEYLVMAAELLEIKSKLLLPKKVQEEDEEIEEDPKTDLINRLLEYQAYKEITKYLQEHEDSRKAIFTKSPEDYTEYIKEVEEINSNLTMDDLVEAFRNYYKRMNDKKPLNTKVTVNEVSVSSRRHDIKRILSKKGKMSFFDLFPVFTKEYVVATFLAILEMAKNKEIVIKQDEMFDDIVCEVLTNE